MKTPVIAGGVMVRCATCRRELKDGTQPLCNECGRGLGRPGFGTARAPGRTSARRRRRRR